MKQSQIASHNLDVSQQQQQSVPYQNQFQDERQIDPYFGSNRHLQADSGQERQTYVNVRSNSTSNIHPQLSENEEANLNISDNSVLFNQYMANPANGQNQQQQQLNQQNRLNISQLNHTQSLDQSSNHLIFGSQLQNHQTSIQSNQIQLNTLNQTTLNTTAQEANDKYDFILRQIIEVEKDSINLNNQFKGILEESGAATDSKVKHQLRGRLIELNEQISKNNQKLFALKRKEQDYMDQIN